jgi:hypothetical protein
MAGRVGDPPQVFPKPFVGTPKRIIERRMLQIILGSVMVLPAVAVLVLTRMIPTIQLMHISTQEYLVEEGHLLQVGLQNYRTLSSDPIFQPTLSFAMILAGVRMILAVLPPLFFALGAASLGRRLRRILGVVSVWPWAVYSPAVLGLTCIFLLNPSFGYATDFLTLSQPAQVPWVILIMDGLSFAGLSLGLCSTAFLAAFKGAAEGYRRKMAVRSVLILGALMVLASAALSIQSFGPTHLINLAGFGSPFYSLMNYLYEQHFSLLRSGLAAAAAMKLLIPIGLAGILAAILILTSNLRILVLPLESKPIHFSSGLKMVGTFLGLVSLGVLFLFFTPVVMKNGPILNMPGRGLITEVQQTLSGLHFGTNLLNTWLGPLVLILLVQLPVTFLGALAIGVYRPLGNASDLLLLLFAPWLLVSENLLSPALFQFLSSFSLEQTPIAMIFPYLINIPLLFVLTLFFKGQRINRTHPDRKPGLMPVFIKPCLPLLAIGIFFSFITIQHALMWPLVISGNPAAQTLPVMYAHLLADPARSLQGIGGVMLLLRTPASLMSLIFMSGALYFVVPRWGIRTGRIIF